MTFSHASDLRAVVEATKLNQLAWTDNMARVNALADGDPPYTRQEQLDNNIEVNCNFLETTKAIADARKTWYSALIGRRIYFTVDIDHKNRHARTWSSKITKGINKVLKNSLDYTELKQATGAQVVLHGIGPSAWNDSFSWLPEEIGLEDLLIPPGTRKHLRNLKHYFIFRKYTSTQLSELTQGARRDPGWNMKVVNAELKRLATEYYGRPANWDFENPVKLQEWYKSNSGYMDSSAVPTVDAWDCYWQDEKNDRVAWYRGLILDSPEGSASAEGEFLYKSDNPVAEKRERLLHINFGDGANKAPFMYHSIRGLGFMLYSPGQLQNRLRCQINQAIFENCVMGFRLTNADDRARLNKIDLYQRGIMLVPQDVQIIPEAERRSINQELAFAGLAQNRQLMGESASQYVQDVEQGSTREQTATEVMAKVNSANAIVSGMLQMAYEYDEHQDREICRRFCLKNSTDPDVKKFRQDMLNEGVPEEALNFERWTVHKERALGGGNKMMAIAQADKFMAVRHQLDPDQQREVTRIYLAANSDDPNLPDRLVPPSPPALSSSRHDGQLAAGAILAGSPVQPRPGTNHIDYVEALLSAMASFLKLIMATGGMASKEQLAGLSALAGAIQMEIQQIAQDPQEKDRAAQYGEALAQMIAVAAELAKRMQKQMQQGAPDQDGAAETRGEIASKLVLAKSKAEISEAAAAQKRQQKQMAFVQGEKRKDIETVLKGRRDLTQAQIDAAAMDLTTAAGIRSKAAISATNTETE